MNLTKVEVSLQDVLQLPPCNTVVPDEVVLALVLNFALVGLSGNVLCLLTFWKQATSKVSDVAPQWHLLAIALADVFAILAALFYIVAEYFWNIPKNCGPPTVFHNRVLMEIFSFSRSLPHATSISGSLILIACSLDRLQAFYFPIVYAQVEQGPRVILASLGSYILGLVVAIVSHKYSVVEMHGRYGLVTFDLPYSQLAYVISQLLICVVLVTVYIWVIVKYRRIQQSRKTILALQQRRLSNEPLHEDTVTKLLLIQGAVTATAASAMSASTACWTLFDVRPDLCRAADYSAYAVTSFRITYNFIIYLLLSKQFRKQVLLLFCNRTRVEPTRPISMIASRLIERTTGKYSNISVVTL